MSEHTETVRFAPLFAGLAVISAAVHIYFNIIGTVSVFYQNVFHFAFFVVLGSMYYPLCRKTADIRWFAVIELIAALLAALAAIYLAFSETLIYERGGTFTTLELAAGIYLLAVLVEYARRVSGWVIPILIIFSLSYIVWLGPYFSGVFNFAGLSFKNVLFRSIYGDDGVFGNLASISSGYVFMFILFGGFLQASGAGDFIIDVSKGFMSRFTGGPGFVAIFASALTGTISGSAVANTASTGVITIPLMKKAGYRSEFAGGIEAAASTGGQLMPPIMGAGAFVMASYTNIPFSQIVLLSIAPALLYFASVFFLVYFETKKQGIVTVPDADFDFLQSLKNNGLTFIIPITLLVVMLTLGYSPSYTAGFSILAVIAVSWIGPNKMGVSKILEAVLIGSRNMIMTAMILVAIGLVVNSIVTAGVGNVFSLMIAEWSNNIILVAIVLIALASLILGMGLPVTASYIVLATLSAPALAGMIQQSFLVDAIVNQGLSDSAMSFIMLANPEAAAQLAGSALNSDTVSRLLDTMPVEILNLLRQEFIPQSQITYTLLAAHLIIFWLSQDSNVTPPVCLVAFTAAAIAKSKPMKTGFESWRLAKGLYIVPVLFAFTPLISGNPVQIIIEFGIALVGIFALSTAMQGFMHHRLGSLSRLLMLVVSLMILQTEYTALEAVGVAVLIGFFLLDRKRPLPF